MCGRKLIIPFLAAAALVGCRAPGNIPTLAERSLFDVVLVVETDPPGAAVFDEGFVKIGDAPVRHVWRIEKLSWSNGKTDFRLLPEGVRIRPGENLSVELAVRAEGYRVKGEVFAVPFSGEEETVTRRVVLKKRGGNG